MVMIKMSVLYLKRKEKDSHLKGKMARKTMFGLSFRPDSQTESGPACHIQHSSNIVSLS